MTLMFVILYSVIGLVFVTVGVLSAVFNVRASEIQRKWVRENELFGRWTADTYTPGVMRGLGIVLAFFGALFIAAATALLVKLL